MDLLDAPCSKTEIIQAHNLKLWNKITPQDWSNYVGDQNKTFVTSPFPINDDINSKIALWAGDITTLACHAIVNSTNESFTDKSPLCERTFSSAGPQLKHFIVNHVKTCRTGEAKITKGFDLPARYVIHSVGPKYNEKYKTAAESALYSCYFKVLQLVREHKIKSIGICPINSVRRQYPSHDGAHIALRTVRRFLEKYGQEIDLVVFAVEDIDVGIYEILMPLYFPRSEKEEEYALYCLPRDIGGQNGEPVILERQIRIATKPMASADDELDQTVDLTSGLESSVAVGKSSFAKMQADVDTRWRKDNNKYRKSDAPTVEAQRKERYDRILRKAKSEDVTEMANMRFLYVTGQDRFGRPAVVLIGHRINFNTVDRERVLVYLVSLLDELAARDYVIIYFHSMTSAVNHAPLNYVHQIYDVLDYKYKKNLKAIYIVHPTFWCRLVSWYFTTFKASDLKRKIFYLGGVEYLNQVIPLDQLQVPSNIMDFDFKVNGVGYNKNGVSVDARGTITTAQEAANSL
ncbi:Protein GDAP2 -like protein [Halotydeus destructor]|nr:Protein GDAP2 -like protein [Halotydeus destructor]